MSPLLRSRIGRLHWLGILALVGGLQLAFWQESSDPFAPVELLLLKVLTPLCLLPLLLSAPRPAALAGAWPARLLGAWVLWLWLRASFGPWRAEGLKTALEYSLEAAAFLLPALAGRRRRLRLLAAFLVGSLAAAAYGVAQHWGVDPWRWSTEFGGRPLGTIGNPDFFGGHLVLAWGLALGWLLASAPGRRLGPWLAFGLLSLVQLYSRTAGAWLGMASVLAAAAALLLAPGARAPRERLGLTRGRLALALLALALASGAGLAAGPGARAARDFAREKSLSVVNRTMMWKAALAQWRQAPVQGAGLCSYRPEYPRLQADILAAEPDKGWNYVVTWLPHENFLYQLCETGLIGLGLFLAAWAACAWRGFKAAAAGDGPALAALLASSGMAGVGLLNTFSNIPPTALGFFLMLGILAWAPQPESGEGAGPVAPATPATPAAPAPPWDGWILALSLALALALGVPAGRELAANRFTREAGRAEKRDDQAEAARLYGRAADLHIVNFTQQSLVGVDYQLAECQRRLGQLDAAVASYRADLAVNPWAPEDHNMLGAALAQLGQAEGRADWVRDGADHLETAVRLSPGYTAALLNLGGSRMVLGDVSGAAQAWDDALRSDTANAQARAYLDLLRTRR